MTRPVAGNLAQLLFARGGARLFALRVRVQGTATGSFSPKAREHAGHQGAQG